MQNCVSDLDLSIQGHFWNFSSIVDITETILHKIVASSM